MDKQLIERIALEEAGEYGLETDAALTDFAHRFLARVDAERDNDAKAWISDGFITTDRSKVNQWSQNGYEVNPLFLSPTIPEGMALVKKAVLRDRGFVYTPWNVSGAAIPIVTVQFDLNDWDSRDAFAEAMLAAAQGERK